MQGDVRKRHGTGRGCPTWMFKVAFEDADRHRYVASSLTRWPPSHSLVLRDTCHATARPKCNLRFLSFWLIELRGRTCAARNGSVQAIPK